MPISPHHTPSMPAPGALEIRKVSAGPYDNNAYVIVSRATGESVIVDTPAEPEKVLAAAAGTEVRAILITHCHPDHIQGHREIVAATGAPVWVHQSEAEMLPLPPQHLFQHLGAIQLGGQSLTILHVPGHTTGGTAILWGKQLFSGDTLFPNGPGKTWSPEAFLQLVSMLKERIFILGDDIAVRPGHGADTLLGREKQQFRLFESRPHSPDLCGDVLWLAPSTAPSRADPS